MPLDTSIPMQVQPVKVMSPQEQFAAENMIQQNLLARQLGNLELQKNQQAVERQNKLASLLSGEYASPEDRESALLKGGFINESAQLGKDRRENLKTEADARSKQIEATQKRLDIAGQAFGYVRNNPTLEAANSVLDYLGSNGIFTPEQIAQYKQTVAADPTKIKALADQAFTSTLSAKEQLMKIDTRNLGGVTQTTGTNPLTGKVEVLSTSRNTVSPDAALSAATTRRGQDMTDARAREANQISRENKPLTDAQAKAALFGSRMKSANDVLASLEQDGKLFSTPGARTGFGVGAVVNTLNSSQGQQLDQAKRDFINAVLRRESGAVIADSEFNNAEQQYFPQIGDSPEVIKQKRNNRELAIRGILAEVPKEKSGVVDEIIGKKPNIDALLDKYK